MYCVARLRLYLYGLTHPYVCRSTVEAERKGSVAGNLTAWDSRGRVNLGLHSLAERATGLYYGHNDALAFPAYISRYAATPGLRPPLVHVAASGLPQQRCKSTRSSHQRAIPQTSCPVFSPPGTIHVE